MPKATRNGKLAYSRIECLRGDGGPELQGLVYDIIELTGFSGRGPAGDPEERRLYNGLRSKRERERREREHPVNTPPVVSAEDDRSRIRAELLKRL